MRYAAEERETAVGDRRKEKAHARSRRKSLESAIQIW
jgi:hypothetical protein